MKKLYQYFPIFIIFLLSLPPLLWWIPKGYVIDGSDIPFFVNPLNELIKHLYPWDTTVNTGMSTLQELPKQILYIIFTFLKIITPNISIMSKVFYCVILFFSGTGMFLFSRKIFPKSMHLSASLLSSIFYMYNLYFVVQITDTPIALGYITFPFLLFVFHKAIETKKIIFYSAIFSMLTIFFPPINPSSFAVFLLLLIIYIVFYSFTNVNNIKQIIRLLLATSILTFFINFRIIYPYIAFLHAQSSEIQNNLADWINGVSKNTSFFHVVRLIGAWDWFENWFGEPYIPFAKKYLENPFLIGISYIPVLLAFVGFLKTRTKLAWFLLIIGIIGILFSMGTHPPFQAIFIFFYNHVPFFWLFRSPWFKFSYWIVFSYSILIGFFTIWVFNKLHNRPRLSLILFTALTLIFLITAYPLFTGKRFFKVWNREGKLSATVVKYPDYLFKTTDYFNKKEDDGRILFSPQFIYQTTAYDWGYGSSRPEIILDLLTLKSILFMPFDQKSHPAPFMNAMTESFYANNTNLLANYLAILSVSYVLQQNDFNYKTAVVRNFSSQLNQFFSKQNFISKEKQFGKWTIYKNSYVFPKIYSPSSFIQISNISDLENISPTNSPFAFSLYDAVSNNLKPKKIRTDNAQLTQFSRSNNFFETTLRLPNDSMLGFYTSKDNTPSLPILIDEENKQSTISGMLLGKGKHTVKIGYKLSDNIVKNASFEKELQDEWRYFDSDQRKGDLEAVLQKNQDATDGSQSLEINVKKKELRLYQQIPIDSDNYYLVSFDYKNMVGEKLHFLIDQEFGGVSHSQDLPFRSSWSSQALLFKPKGNSSFFDIYLSLPAGANGSKTLIDNIKAQKVNTPINGYYYAEVFENKENNANVTFEKIDPTEYKVSIQAKLPFFLIFNEEYDKDWKAIVDGEIVTKHFKINGYANGYFIDKTGNFQIILKHGAQYIMNYSLYVSILSFFIIALILLLLI